MALNSIFSRITAHQDEVKQFDKKIQVVAKKCHPLIKASLPLFYEYIGEEVPQDQTKLWRGTCAFVSPRGQDLIWPMLGEISISGVTLSNSICLLDLIQGATFRHQVCLIQTTLYSDQIGEKQRVSSIDFSSRQFPKLAPKLFTVEFSESIPALLKDWQNSGQYGQFDSYRDHSYIYT